MDKNKKSKPMIVGFMVKVKISGKEPSDIRTAVACIKEDLRVQGSCHGEKNFEYQYKSVYEIGEML